MKRRNKEDTVAQIETRNEPVVTLTMTARETRVLRAILAEAWSMIDITSAVARRSPKDESTAATDCLQIQGALRDARV